MRFGELSESECRKFDEVLKKNSKSIVSDDKAQLWPEDDEVLSKSYFGKEQEEL